MENVNRKIDCELGNFIWSIVDKSGLSQEKWAELLEVFSANDELLLFRSKKAHA